LERRAQASALTHVEDVTVFREPINQGGCQMRIFEKRTPFREA
jgi:hypothetical protein